MLALLPSYDAFGELAGKARTIVVAGQEPPRLFRDCRVGKLPLVLNAPNATISPSDPKAGDDVVLAIGLEHCLVRSVTLPKAAVRQIDALLALDLARLSPFGSEGLLSCWVEEAGTPDDGQLHLRHVILKTEVIDQWTQPITEAGARLIALILLGEDGAALPLAFGPDLKPFHQVKLRRLAQAAGIAAGLLLVSLLGLHAVIAHITARDLTLIETAEQQQALKASANRKTIAARQSASERGKFFADYLRKTNGIPLVIDELTRLLPDTAAIDGLTIEDGVITIDGTAVQAEPLIAALEASGLFKNVSFTAPVFTNPGDARSHFTIRLERESDEAPS